MLQYIFQFSFKVQFMIYISLPKQIVNTFVLESLIKGLKYWKLGFNDLLFVCCFLSRLKLFLSYRESPVPVKGRLKSNKYQPCAFQAHTIPSFKLTSKVKETNYIRHLPPTDWVAIITSSFPFQKFYQRLNFSSVLCVHPNAENLSVRKHTYVSDHTRIFYSSYILLPIVYSQEINSINILTMITSINLSNNINIF